MRTAPDGRTVPTRRPYIVYDRDRGTLSEHDTLREAAEDVAAQKVAGGRSSAGVYAWSPSHGWVVVDTYAGEGGR